MPLNIPQRLFLEQARSDYEIYGWLARADVCHRLHYLQMSTEKLSKVWFWRSMSPPPGGHHTFEPFIRALATSGRADFHAMFGYKSPARFQSQRDPIFALVARIQGLVPWPVNPNPEYPWPRSMPTDGPLNHPSLVRLWRDWSTTTTGRRLRSFVETMLRDYLTFFP